MKTHGAFILLLDLLVEASSKRTFFSWRRDFASGVFMVLSGWNTRLGFDLLQKEGHNRIVDGFVVVSADFA
jgi:hypothetical protein